MKVVEVWPGTGWYTEILAPLLRDKGQYYAAAIAPDPGSEYVTNAAARTSMTSSPRGPICTARSQITSIGPEGHDIAPPGSIDMVVTFRNMHNWMADDWRAAGVRVDVQAR